jgi:hypothetical protein
MTAWPAFLRPSKREPASQLVWTFLVTVSVTGVKVLDLIPEPKPISVGVAALKGKLSPAAEKFWQCAKKAVAAK